MKKKTSILVSLCLLAFCSCNGGCTSSKTFTVTFSGNGGTLVSGEEVQKVSKASEIIQPTYKRDGYDFNGWDTDISKITTDTTVKAQWTVTPSKMFTVTFFGNGGTLVSGEEVQKVSKASEIIQPTYKRDGYDFNGWDTDISKITTDTTVKAQWTVTPSKMFTVTFFGNGGTLVSGEEVQKVSKASEIVAPIYERDEYDFYGWDTDISKITTDTTVKALWLGKEINISIDGFTKEDNTLKGKTNYDVNSFDFTDKVHVNDDCSWKLFKDEECTIEITEKTINLETGDNTNYILVTSFLGESATFIVTLRRLALFTVSFDTGDGGSSITPQSVQEGDLSTRPTNPIKTNYVFINWFKEDTFDNIFDFSTPITSNIILYAKWVEEYVGECLYSLNSDQKSYRVSGVEDNTCTSYNILSTYNELPVTSIGDSAFEDCSFLISINIPNSVTSIGYLAFYNCYSLTSINIPNSVTSICDTAFAFCSFLYSINIPNSVTSIGFRAFACCFSLNSIVVDSNNSKYDSRDNSNAIIETSTNILIAGCKNTIIPPSVTSISGYAFERCSFLTSINIPNSVTSIGDAAFSSCSLLQSLTIGEGVTSIGVIAFSNCSSLTSISYVGTISKWNSVTKGYAWHDYCPATVVHCNDGDVPLD